MVGSDHTVLLASAHTVYHFDLDTGQKIRQFGTKGQGPLEFGNIRALNWDGGHYLVVDARALKTTLINTAGEWVWTNSIYFRSVSGTKSYLVGDGRTTPLKDYRKRIPKLRIFQYDTDGIQPQGDFFHLVSQEVINLGLNYSKNFVAIDHKNIYVIDEVLPTVFIYDKRTRVETAKILFKIPGFVHGPNEFPKFRIPPNLKKYWKWHWSWSRINKIAIWKNKLIVGYELVCMDTDSSGCLSPTFSCFISDLKTGDGHQVKLESGMLLGVSRGQLIIFHDWDDETYGEPAYRISKIPIP